MRSWERQYRDGQKFARRSEVKVGLNLMFKKLRTAGVDAQQNFLCCGSCASYEMGTRAQTPISSYVYYHNQDDASMGSSGGVYLAYGRAGTMDLDDRLHDEFCRQLALLIVKCAEDSGLQVTWNGDVGTRIWVETRPSGSVALQKVS